MINFPNLEQEILEFWRREKIFQKTLEKKSPKGNFIFFEGPPTANGRPGIHHVLTRAFKDIILRYKTMRGFRVPRKAGWDTHGLPVELEVEKKLGISGKKQIEDIVPGNPRASITEFNKLCKESVWTYKKDWEELTERVAFWLDMEHPYITYENAYIETLWWIIKQIYEKGLLYEDYKIVPYCPRCGTTLSSHEVALGYKDDTEDPSVYVKFEIRNPAPEQARYGASSKSAINPKSKILNLKSCFLVWTTTPWTLPGNVALAVGRDVKYVKVKISNPQLSASSPQEFASNEEWILAKDQLAVINEPYEIIEELKGKDLEGMGYEPLYATRTGKNDHDYKVYTAPFVSTTDGTGIVHIAPAFGEEDHALGKEKKLSTLLTVDPDGKINVDVPGKGKFVKDADIDIIEDLRARALLYRAETIKHTYPFCWRCSTPLLYYAKVSWWIRMSALRDQLIKNNKQINWAPAHIKEGRFGEWLSGIKDWAFSRERYWGTPLPVWRCANCKSIKIVGSIADFSLAKNNYWIMRHGEANSNTKRIVTSNPTVPVHITDEGRKQVVKTAAKLKKKKINLIYASDFVRTRETAEIVSRALGIPVVYDSRLYELNVGDYEGLQIPEYLAKFPCGNSERFDTRAPNGENLRDVLRRQVNLIRELETKYQGKNILLVGHGDPLWVLEGAYRGKSPQEIVTTAASGDYIGRGELRKLPVRNIPQDEDGFLDLHRPYVDEITLNCKKCGGSMRRVADVADVWFDSGSMPFAQSASLGNPKSETRNPKAFPADYIAEAIDQTRGWFYTLLAVSTLLGHKTPPYKNVVCLSHILDAKGIKMSKSKGNVVIPGEVINKFGADSLRFYLYTVSQPGDPKKFDSRGVDEVLKKTFLILWNVFEFWKLYVGKEPEAPKALRAQNQKHILDAWILSKLNLLIKEVTDHLEKYEITEAGRKLAEFINDLSTWYVRRSRDRFKIPGPGREAALQTLGLVLTTLAKLLAPFAPFIAEKIYKEISGGESVHLEKWPELHKKPADHKVIADMELVRKIVSLALEERAKSGIPVRQPLANLKIKNASLRSEFLELIKDEVNIKNVEVIQGNAQLQIELDTTISEDLRLEGLKRELVRQINSLRKESGLTIHDRVELYWETTNMELQEMIKKFTEEIKKDTLSKSLNFGHGKIDFQKEIGVGEGAIWIGIKK